MWSVVTTWRVSVMPKPYCGIRASSEISSVFRKAGTRSTAAYLPNTLHPPLLPYRFPGSHPRRTGITGAARVRAWEPIREQRGVESVRQVRRRAARTGFPEDRADLAARADPAVRLRHHAHPPRRHHTRHELHGRGSGGCGVHAVSYTH